MIEMDGSSGGNQQRVKQSDLCVVLLTQQCERAKHPCCRMKPVARISE